MSVDAKRKSEIKDSEYKRILKIRDFLRANPSVAYSASEILEKTGVSCADNLLYFQRGPYAKAVGIKRMDVVPNGKSGYCGTTHCYYCNPSWRKGWWKFWK